VAEGIEPERAGEVASLAAGDLTRARILATDERLHLRLTAWRDAPLQLDGTGARATDTVDELRSMIDDALAPLVARQEAEVVAFDEEAERYGQRGGSGRRKTLETRHKRIARKFRTDELRAGLATLARAYREEAAVAAHPATPLGALDAIQRTAEALVFNPNEELMLYGLFATLPPLRP
jgi:hypothetical protein